MLSEIDSWDRAAKTFVGTWRADSLRGRFARGAVWSLVGAVVSQGCNLAASVVTARLLGRDQFGGYGMIQNTIGMFGVFAGMGLGLTATKYVAEFRTSDPDRAGRIIALSSAAAFGTSMIAAVVLLASAPWLAANTLNAPYLSTELRISAGILFLNALNGAQTGVLAGFEAFRHIARVNLIRGLFTFPLAVSGAMLWGLRGALAALITTAALGWVLNHIAISTQCRRHSVPVRWKNFWSERAILWRFSLPAFLGGAMASPAMWAACAVLANQQHGYSEMGIFTAANQWRTAVAFLPSLLSQPLLSMLSSVVGAGDFPSFRRLLRANLLLSFGLSSLIAIPIIACAPWIMKAYGRDFQTGRPVLVLLVVATVLSATAAVIGQAIMSLDKVWWTYVLNLVWALVLMAAALLLVPRHGALGLAESFLAAYALNALSACVYARILLRRRFETPGL